MINALNDNPQDSDFFWRQLGKFHNIVSTANLLMEKHRLPEKHRKNVEKQATQIKYCLKLAREYFFAARTVSPATKGVLQYYGIMNLAIAEFLFKQDGDSSLDRIKSKDRHHGLEFSFDEASKNHHETFLKSGRRLKSTPYINSSERYGTFNLWQRTGSGYSQVGESINISKDVTYQTNPILGVSSGHLDPFPKHGISLYDALTSLPFLDSTLNLMSLPSNFIKGSLKQTVISASKTTSLQWIIQPHTSSDIERFLGRFSFPDSVEISKPNQGGAILKYQFDQDAEPEKMTFPSGVQYTSEELFWYIEDHALNEFGYIYVALHMLGNFSRYYPHYWLAEIEKATELSVICDHFMQNLELRAATLIYSELSNCMCLY